MELPLEDSLRLVTTPLLGRLKGERSLTKPDTGMVTLEDGTFLNLVNGTPDASELYCVAWNNGLLWEGWLSSENVEDISENPWCMPCETRLPIIEVLKRSVLAKGKEDWENENSAVVVEPGELYHIRTWRDGWAYATALKESYSRPSELDQWEKCRCSGWVPIYVLELVGSTMSELVENLEQEKLDESAVMQLQEMIANKPKPCAMQSNPDMPEIVAISHNAEMDHWRQHFANEEKLTAGHEGNEEEQEEEPAEEAPRTEFLELREPPEESCPLYVCMQDCGPPPGRVLQEGQEHLLRLRKGDVVRIVSRIEPQMKWLRGYLDSIEQNKPRGWFPKESVQPLQKDERNSSGPMISRLLGKDEEIIARERPKLPDALRRSRVAR